MLPLQISEAKLFVIGGIGYVFVEREALEHHFAVNTSMWQGKVLMYK